MSEYLISLSINGQPEVQCLVPERESENTLGLTDVGIAWNETCNVSLYHETLDDIHELMIHSNGDATITLERAGRQHTLIAHHPVRLLTNDVVQIDKTRIRIVTIYQSHTKSSNKPSLWSRIAKSAMFATAASMLLALIPGCKVGVDRMTGNVAPIPEPQVEVEETVGEESAPENHFIDSDQPNCENEDGSCEVNPPQPNDTVEPKPLAGEPALDAPSEQDVVADEPAPTVAPRRHAGVPKRITPPSNDAQNSDNSNSDESNSGEEVKPIVIKRAPNDTVEPKRLTGDVARVPTTNNDDNN